MSLLAVLSCTLLAIVADAQTPSGDSPKAPLEAEAKASQGQAAQPLKSVKAPPEMCAMLDEPNIRGRMDGLLYKLLVNCGREHELGSVIQRPSIEPEASEGPANPPDVLVNDPSAEDSASSRVQNETSISYNETTGTICSGYNDSFHGIVEGTGFTGFSRSTDGGATFDDRGALGSNSGGDPSIVWRRSDGKFYFAALESSGLGVWRSDDDCMTFVYVGNSHVSSGDDKELMAVDNFMGSAFFGRLYMAWTDFNAGARIYVNYSDDGGETWSAALPVSEAGGDFQGAWPVVAPNGDLFVGWVRWNPFPAGPVDIEIVRSTDGGDTFTPVADPMTGEVNPRDATATSNCGRPALDANIRYLPSPQMAIGPDGALHVVYSYDPDGFDTGDEIDVFYRKSTDSGATWEPEIRLSDDATTNDQYFPTVSVGASNVVVATFYDRRLDPDNILIDYYKRISFDGGTTWQPSERVSDVSSPVFLDSGLAGCYHGDYDQQIQTESHVLVQWADDRNIQGGNNNSDTFLELTPISEDFLVLPSPSSRTVCAPDDAVYALDVPQFMGFTEMVTLATGSLPTGLSAAFSSTVVTPPGTSELTLSGTGAVTAGSYAVDVTGTSSPSAIVKDTSVGLEVFDQVPGAVILTDPVDDATDIDINPTVTWDAAVQAQTYTIEVATDEAFTNIVFSTTTSGTSQEVAAGLDPVTEYFWRVRGVNICGDGADSSVFSFTTRAIPPVLLVDDDDNTPDTRAAFEDALNALGVDFEVWDTANSDNEPATSELPPFNTILWFTGDEFGGSAGPGTESETVLGDWLDEGGNCLLISGQDYVFDRGVTPFMMTYLGLASATSDVSQTVVTGQGSAFSGLGPYTLSYPPLSNFSDALVPDATAEVAFGGDNGNAAINKAGAAYRTVFLGFPFGAIPTDTDRQAVLAEILDFCSGLFSDSFESGDTSSWSNTQGN
ncbi:MAG: hypothetical protein AAF560_19470 [Acidobacteriota bacterium]